MIIMPDSKPHVFKAVTPYEMLLVMINLGKYVIYGQKGGPI